MQFIKKILPLLLLLTYVQSFSQATAIRGIVKDAVTGKPIQFVNVFFSGTKIGTTTNEQGYFNLSINKNFSNLTISYVGYKTEVRRIVPQVSQEITVSLAQDNNTDVVVVSSRKKIKYTNKNNPAVELIRKVIANKDKNRPGRYDCVEYQKYEKVKVSFSNLAEKLSQAAPLKNYKFIFENLDTTSFDGKTLLPVYMEETLSKYYFKKKPEKSNSIILADKKVNFGEFIDTKGISSYLNRLYEDVDVYQNDINIFTQQVLSPIADLAPTFYMFFIKDTITVGNQKLVKLNFYPRNPEDLLFKGNIYITLDSNYAVQKVDLSMSKYSSINFIRNFRIDQNFEKASDERYFLSKSTMRAEFALTKSKGFFGERSVSYKDFIINEPREDSLYNSKLEFAELNADLPKSDSILQKYRHTPLTNVEAKVYTNVDSLQNMTSFKRTLDWITFLVAGYKRLTPYFEIGPANAFYSFNPVEGFKLRFGGRTTEALSKTLYFETYAAYGFKDKKVKYFGSAAYSFNKKSVYGFPLNYLKVSYQQDTKIPGQELQFVQEDNFLLSFKRGNNDKYLYNRFFKVNYVKEFPSRLSYNFGFKYWNQTPAGAIQYTKIENGTPFDVRNLTISEFSAELRWAPKEQFYQGKIYRIPIINRYPIFTLRVAAGVKGVMQSEYNYQAVSFNFYKRFYLSQLGYADIVAESGVTFGQVPFPLLTIHRANQTFAYQLNSYNLMNFLEFVSDQFASVSIDYNFNGFFFNKIPLLKKLKWRERMSFKILYGGLRDENNPTKTNAVYQLPRYENGTPYTFSLGSQPYIEGSIGIGNIFKLIRIDVVRRFTYTNNPDVSTIGIRGRFKFDF
ncbi:MAG: DUF5686 family protein [Chitinophagaceae bacterium]